MDEEHGTTEIGLILCQQTYTQHEASEAAIADHPAGKVKFMPEELWED